MYNHVAMQVENPLEDLPGVLPSDVLRQSTVGFQLVFDGTLSTQENKALIAAPGRLSNNSTFMPERSSSAHLVEAAGERPLGCRSVLATPAASWLRVACRPLLRGRWHNPCL